MDLIELRILIAGLAKQMQDRMTPANGKPDQTDLARAERIVELVKEAIKK